MDKTRAPVILLSGSAASVVKTAELAPPRRLRTRAITPLNALPLVACLASAAGAQQAVSRADAIAAALKVGPRLDLARVDTVAASAGVITSRARPNPTLA